MTSYYELKHKYPQKTWIRSIEIAISLAVFNIFAQKLLYTFRNMLSACSDQIIPNFKRDKEITWATLVMGVKY